MFKVVKPSALYGAHVRENDAFVQSGRSIVKCVNGKTVDKTKYVRAISCVVQYETIPGETIDPMRFSMWGSYPWHTTINDDGEYELPPYQEVARWRYVGYTVDECNKGIAPAKTKPGIVIDNGWFVSAERAKRNGYDVPDDFKSSWGAKKMHVKMPTVDDILADPLHWQFQNHWSIENANASPIPQEWQWPLWSTLYIEQQRALIEMITGYKPSIHDLWLRGFSGLFGGL